MTKELAAQYEEIVAAIVEAVPECATREWNAGHGSSDEGWYPPDPNLEDVLRAYRKDKDLTQYLVEKWYYIDQEELLFKWHLGKSLREQSKETITFLHSLLCPKK